MKPFRPHAFPPRGLRKSSIARTLKTANERLAKYNDFLRQAPSPHRLFSQLINLETIASVNSQHIKPDLEEFLRDIDRKKNPGLRLARNCRDALVWACKHPGNALSKEQICAIHQKIKYKTSLPIDVGNYRNRQNWIGPEGCTIEQAYFFPPAAKEVERLMKKLLRYANKKEKEPLLQLALFFAQMLIIHPFMDGNGRIVRILIPIFLEQKKVLDAPLLFMSRYFLKYRLNYFLKLFQLRESNQWEAWVLFFLRGILFEIRKTQELLKQILALYEKVRRQCPEVKRETVLFLFEHPVFSPLKDSKAQTSLRKSKFIEKGSGNMFLFSPLLKLLNRYKKY